MSHLPARGAYQDSSPEQLWQLNGRSMLMDVQGGEFLLDDSVINVHPPPFASRIPKPSANAQPKSIDDRTPRPAHPRPCMLPITAKAIALGPQTARRRRISSTKDAHKTSVQLSIPLPEAVDNVAPDHTVVRASRATSSHSRTREAISPPEISSPAPEDAIVAPPALPDFTSAHKRNTSTTNVAVSLMQPKSILKRTKSTNLSQPLRPLGPEEGEAQMEPPRRQSGRLLEFALPEHTNTPVPFPREPEVVYESEDAPRPVSSVTAEQPTAMEWEAHPGNHSMDLRTDREDVFVDSVPVQGCPRRLSIIRSTLHPEELEREVTEVSNIQEDGMIASGSLPSLPLCSSTGVPPARYVDWKMEPPIEATPEPEPEPESRPVTQSRRFSVVVPRLLPPIDLEAEERPVPTQVEVREPGPRVEGQPIRPRRTSVRALQSPELIVAALPQPSPLPTSLLPSSYASVSHALVESKSKPSAPLSVAQTRKERRKSQAPVRGKVATSRPKRNSEVPKASSRSLTQVGAPRRHLQSLQRQRHPTPALESVSRPVFQGATNSSTGVTIPTKPKGVHQLAAQQQSTERTTPFASQSQPSHRSTAHSQTTFVPAPVQEPPAISGARTSIIATSAASSNSATNISVVLRHSTGSERVPDDMFERRKRDNYVAKPVGLDLTDHSTRGRGLDAVGSTNASMSLNHIDPNVTLSTSMPGEWVENSSVIIKRHEKSRSASHPPSSPILAKLVEPRDMVGSESGGDEDSEDTEVGEALEPERMRELTLSRQPDLTIEDLEHDSSSVSPVKRKPSSTLHSQSRPGTTSKPPSRAPSRPPLEIRALPLRRVSARPPSAIRLQPRSRSGGPADPAHSTSQARSASNPPYIKPASTAARVSDEGLGAKLAQFGEMLLSVVSSGLSFPSANTSSETIRHPDLRVSELSPRKRASSAASQRGVRGDRGRPITRENRGRPVTRELRSKPIPQNVVPPPGILKKPRSNEAPRSVHAPKRVIPHPVARVPPKSSRLKGGTHEVVAAPSHQISKKSASQTLEHPTSARPRPHAQQRPRSRSTSISIDYGAGIEMEREPDVNISIVDAYEAKMFPSRVVEPSFANIAQSSPARPRRSNSRKRTLDPEINGAEQDRGAKRIRIDNDYVSSDLHTREPSAPVKSRDQSRNQSAQNLESEGSPVQPRARSRSNSRPRMEEIVPRGYLDQYHDEEIRDVLMGLNQGEVEEDVFGSVLENPSSRPDSPTGSCPRRKAKTSRRKRSPLLRSPRVNALKVRRNTIASKCRLTVPRSPKFSETHKQRALRGIARERERKEREKQELKKKEEEKRLRLECWQMPPSPPALGREPKVTVPQALTFQSDTRAEHRKVFEEKRKLWEARSSALTTSTSSQGSHPIRKPTRHIYPSAAPKLSTETRAVQRREFDEAIRQKEAELERLHAERARQLEQEEAVWRKQERRRLDKNVKANPIPEWYENAPRRGNTKA